VVYVEGLVGQKWRSSTRDPYFGQSAELSMPSRPWIASSTEVVYVEGLVGWIYVEGETDTYIYHLVFDRLLDTALSPEESTELIARNDHRLSAATVLNN
jgi:Domain of unknown function (DUF5753)